MNNTYKTHMVLPNGNAVVTDNNGRYWIVDKNMNPIGKPYADIQDARYHNPRGWKTLYSCYEIPYKYLEVRSFDGKCGLVDIYNNCIIEEKYMSISIDYFDNRLFYVVTDRRMNNFGFVYNGIEHIGYEVLEPFQKGYAVAHQFNDNRKFNPGLGVINLQGDVIIDFKYYFLEQRGVYFAARKRIGDKEFYGIIDIAENITAPYVDGDKGSFRRCWFMVGLVDMFGNINEKHVLYVYQEFIDFFCHAEIAAGQFCKELRCQVRHVRHYHFQWLFDVLSPNTTFPYFVCLWSPIAPDYEVGTRIKIDSIKFEKVVFENLELKLWATGEAE